ncbi:hypothetical protein ILYODFUR_030142 [Ilyodon furcidens]|uniref:Uncharacterized protein n=1 Tax=Ilyodon furcidens TaxID=33524 RepID=A0ABV0VL34_9TELE
MNLGCVGPAAETELCSGGKPFIWGDLARQDDTRTGNLASGWGLCAALWGVSNLLNILTTSHLQTVAALAKGYWCNSSSCSTNTGKRSRQKCLA